MSDPAHDLALKELTSMGFSEAKSKKALKQTKNSGTQAALDWLLAHADDPEPQEEEKDDDDEDEALAGEAAGGEAKSLKCLQCGKIFRNTALASYHGDKSGHDQFEESTEEVKPLTEEEKKEKLAELREKMAAKRALKAKQEAEDAKKNEAIRRKGGQDMGALREEIKIKEAERAAAAAKKAKIEDAAAKARVKAQIEADKRERAEKAAREKALREGRELPSSSSSAPPPKPASAIAAPKSNAREARLQIRLPPSNPAPPITFTLPAETTLGQLANMVAEQTGMRVVDVKFSIPFPRKVFSAGEMSKSLGELGLTPSSVLMLS
ncbi:hypothetical protein BT69DRAFT_1329068 [Atractiella rhizophila]|nr:hypothetical protein BT69DRAFT_1329068 [Atractiella rhizophila]